MYADVLVELMLADFLLWRCLQGGPLTGADLKRDGPDPRVDWPALRARNVPLLRKLTDVHGACAVVAREGERIVGTLRFQPKGPDLRTPGREPPASTSFGPTQSRTRIRDSPPSLK